MDKFIVKKSKGISEIMVLMWGYKDYSSYEYRKIRYIPNAETGFYQAIISRLLAEGFKVVSVKNKKERNEETTLRRKKK